VATIPALIMGTGATLATLGILLMARQSVIADLEEAVETASAGWSPRLNFQLTPQGPVYLGGAAWRF